MAQIAVIDSSETADLPPEALKELLSDCTCTICQGLYTNPHQLTCGHTFCLKCFDKLKRKWHKGKNSGEGRFARLLRMGSGESGSGGDPLLCPVCRKSIDPYKQAKPDRTATTLLQTLKAVKANCCKYPDCWCKPKICCTNCACGLCSEHHRAQLEGLRTDCVALVGEADKFLLTKADEAARLDADLAKAHEQLDSLSRSMSDALQKQLGACRDQLAQARLTWTQEGSQLAEETAWLSSETAQLHQLLDAGDTASAAASREQLEHRLREARTRHPPVWVQLNCQPDKLLSEHESLLARVSARLLKRPYDRDTGQLKPCLVRRTKRAEPWEVRLMGRDRLLVNYKGFPTRKLHVFCPDSLSETGEIELELTQGQFPGQICVCNTRDRVLASDPRNHCVYEFDFQGHVVAKFGEKGSGPCQLHSPKGVYSSADGLLYVADSKNKRVQLFDPRQGYSRAGCLQDDSLTSGIQAVLAGPEAVVVGDRSANILVTFDTRSRASLGQVPAGGEPFDACADAYGNVLVSLTRERQIKVFDPSGAACINTFTVAGRPDEVESPSDRPLKQYLHGVAFDPDNCRLYVAEAFGRRLLRFDM